MVACCTGFVKSADNRFGEQIERIGPTDDAPSSIVHRLSSNAGTLLRFAVIGLLRPYFARREIDAKRLLRQFDKQVARAFWDSDLAERVKYAILCPAGHQEAAAPRANSRQRGIAGRFAAVVARVDQA